VGGGAGNLYYGDRKDKGKGMKKSKKEKEQIDNSNQDQREEKITVGWKKSMRAHGSMKGRMQEDVGE